MDYTEHVCVVREDIGKVRIDKFLADSLAFSRAKIQASIKSGRVLVNNNIVKCHYILEPYDKVIARLPCPVDLDLLIPEDLPLEVIYEDPDLLVINKPAQMVVHPDDNHRTGTLANALAYHYRDLPLKDDMVTRPGLVHRLDKGTSGLLVVAKSAKSLNDLEQQFYTHSVKRVYCALVWGIPKYESGTIDTYMCKDGMVYSASKTVPSGKPCKRAITHYTVIKSFDYVTLIKCMLETGRTHQIRVHMQHIGHPVFGDLMYGGSNIMVGQHYISYKAFVKNCFKLMPHQALHATAIAFKHPITGKLMQFEAALPENFTKLIEKWESYARSVKHAVKKDKTVW